MSAAAYPGDSQARTAADLTDEQAMTLGCVVTHMTADEALTIMARLHDLPMGEVPPESDPPALVRMDIEKAAREHEAWVELTKWREVDRQHGVFEDAGIMALERLRDVADRLGLAS